MTKLTKDEVARTISMMNEIPYGYRKKPDFNENCHLPDLKKRNIRYSSWWRYLETIYLFCGEEKGKVLDIGSGWGTTYYILRELKFDVWALDLGNPSNISLERYEKHNLDSDGTMPYGDESFDYVVCSEVIEHLHRPFNLISEIQRILRPGGFAVLTTPNILNLTSRFNFLRNGSHNKFYWHKDSTGKYMPIHGIGGHVMPLDYFQLNYIFGSLNMAVESIRTNVLSRVSKAKLIPFLLTDTFVKFFSHTKIPMELRYGDSLILKVRK